MYNFSEFGVSPEFIDSWQKMGGVKGQCIYEFWITTLNYNFFQTLQKYLLSHLKYLFENNCIAENDALNIIWIFFFSMGSEYYIHFKYYDCE